MTFVLVVPGTDGLDVVFRFHLLQIVHYLLIGDIATTGQRQYIFTERHE